MKHLAKLFTILRPLDTFAIAQRPVHATHVSQGQPAVALAVLITLLQWPDKSLPYDLVRGFQLTGHLPKSGIFRSVANESRGDSSLLLGADSVAYVDA
eukprot:8926576-Karenia_brevis.AAC.1